MSICVLQDWVMGLTLMQQGVLLAAVRGPDGIVKDHVSKVLLRWYRRCILNMAFESAAAGKAIVAPNPAWAGGGSFTGPMTQHYLDQALGGWMPCAIGTNDSRDPVGEGWAALNWAVEDYLRATDEIPHHYQLHFLHAAEVLGYKHPEERRRNWWNRLYRRLANDMHLNPETEEQMNTRLGDVEKQWRAAEEVTAK